MSKPSIVTGPVSRRLFTGAAGATLVSTSAAADLPVVPEQATARPQPQLPRKQSLLENEKLGWAVVGLGKLALGEVLPAFGASRMSRLVALVSGSPQKARDVAARSGIQPDAIYDYDGFDRIADDPRIDVVYIILPNGLCEKPMAVTVEQCRAMMQAAEQADRKLMVAYRAQYEPTSLEAMQMIRNGDLGDLRMVVTENGRPSDPADPADQWRLQRSLAGGGSLMDIGVYGVNGARYLTGNDRTAGRHRLELPAGRGFTRQIAVPGLSMEFPSVACTDDGLCHVTTAMGFANAASSISAVVLDGRFDLSSTYFLVAGIAGVDPTDGTLGSAHWTRFVIDGGLRHEIDPSQIPEGWSSGTVALGAAAPGPKAKWSAGTEIYRLNEPLLQRAYELTRDVELQDGEAAARYRLAYGSAPATAAPAVSVCDTLSSDTYCHGSMIAAAVADYVKMLTDGVGNYCTTQMEDNATLTALRRGADARLLDFDRILVLRTGSNFDREPEGMTSITSLSANSGGFPLATANTYQVGSKWADTVLAGWDDWKNGVPPATKP